MSAASDIYSFETILALALKQLFDAQEIKSFTLLDAPDFQRDRPCVVVAFRTGAGQGQWRAVNVGGENYPVETSWKGIFDLELITKADVSEHLAFIAQVRSIMFRMGALVNGQPPMTLHKIQPFFRDAGTNSDWTPQEGVYTSRLLFEIDFSIQADAWAALETETNNT